MSQPRLTIGRVPIDVVTFQQAMERIEALVDAKQGGSVFTPNVDHVVNVDSDDVFAAAYQRASLSVADGMPLVWASKVLGQPLPERVAGSDLLEPTLQLAAKRGWRVFFLGAAPGVAEKAAAVARERFGTNVVGTDSPFVKLDDTAQIDRIARQLADSKAEIVMMAFGAPKQELLIDRIAERVKPAVMLGIGASLDFLAGTVKRAPAIMRSTGFEWLYRLSQEPGRLWKRYLVNDPKFAVILLRTLKRQKLG
ncbi:MAG: WecB/TagA/CpsF family glycosyltransferase [Archangiaceae bacterium]|nr:WecB/TagA/CpsF family glycosyltransferase [Archangiaceae bacterium]